MQRSNGYCSSFLLFMAKQRDKWPGQDTTARITLRLILGLLLYFGIAVALFRKFGGEACEVFLFCRAVSKSRTSMHAFSTTFRDLRPTNDRPPSVSAI
jgi:hypothetical protein